MHLRLTLTFDTPNIHNFMYELLKNINEPNNEIIKKISDRKNDKNIIADDWLEDSLRADIYNYETSKNLICRMAEYFKIIETCKRKDSARKNVYTLLFPKEGKVDDDKFPQIEHIHAVKDKNKWRDNELLNSIGNLTMLEKGINESVQNAPFAQKKKKKGDQKKDYSDSDYPTIKWLCNQRNWTKEDAEKRRDEVVNAIWEYLFPKENKEK